MTIKNDGQAQMAITSIAISRPPTSRSSAVSRIFGRIISAPNCPNPADIHMARMRSM